MRDIVIYGLLLLAYVASVTCYAEVNTVVIPDPAKKPPVVQVVPEPKQVKPAKPTPIPSFYNPLTSFLGTAKGMVSSVSAVGGLILFVLAAVGYVRYLQNPQQHHLSSVLGSLMFGALLFALAYMQEPQLKKPVQSSKVGKVIKSKNKQQAVPVL